MRMSRIPRWSRIVLLVGLLLAGALAVSGQDDPRLIFTAEWPERINARDCNDLSQIKRILQGSYPLIVKSISIQTFAGVTSDWVEVEISGERLCIRIDVMRSGLPPTITTYDMQAILTVIVPGPVSLSLDTLRVQMLAAEIETAPPFSLREIAGTLAVDASYDDIRAAVEEASRAAGQDVLVLLVDGGGGQELVVVAVSDADGQPAYFVGPRPAQGGDFSLERLPDLSEGYRPALRAVTSGPEFVGIDAQDEVGYLFDLDSWTWRATDAA
jgi:hypothetical protein